MRRARLVALALLVALVAALLPVIVVLPYLEP